MLIREIGGEVVLIEKLAKLVPQKHKELLTGIGDDAAVIKMANDKQNYLLVTTDTLIANDHFNTRWSTAEQIGHKSVECNVSDIAAMGGTPTLMFISLVLTPATTLEWVENLYHGIQAACNRYKIVVAGGDTTHGQVETINITLLGKVFKKNLCLRSHAEPGDILAVSGQLGASAAGLSCLRKNIPLTPHLQKKHLNPKCRLAAAQKIAPFVHAMIDISDGLASEVNHICKQSNTGAYILAKDIPLHAEVKKAGAKLGVDPLDFALNGGEDFELLFSINENNLKQLDKTGLPYFIVGKITNKDRECVLIRESGERIPLKGGYDHFR
jgi:thiamine-monophosphate kinase